MGIFWNSACFPQYSSKMSKSSCARPSAKTGMRTRPPRLRMPEMDFMSACSRSSRGVCVEMPYVDSVMSTSTLTPRGTSAETRWRSCSRE